MVSGKHPGTQDTWANSRKGEIKAVKAKAETQTPLTGRVLEPELLAAPASLEGWRAVCRH